MFLKCNFLVTESVTGQVNKIVKSLAFLKPQRGDRGPRSALQPR